MFIYPAIDLFENKAVRLFKGDYLFVTISHIIVKDVFIDFQGWEKYSYDKIQTDRCAYLGW